LNTPLRIIVSGLACSRGDRRLFGGLSLAMRSGEALVVTGPNGVGKTTLLRALAGFVRPDEGSIVIEGARSDAPLAQAAHFLGHRDGLRAALTLRENLALAPALMGGEGAPIAEAAARLGLTRLLDLPVGVFSAGQRRRAALARLLAARRPIWLLDEPTSALDGESQGGAAALMAEHVGAGGLLVAATHQPLGVAARELAFARDGAHSMRDRAE